MKDNRKTKKILFVYPDYAETFWSFKHSLKIIGKKSAFPPLGILTLSSMLPDHWEKKLVDMNVSKLTDKDIQWADYVFISAMIVQKESVFRVVDRIKGMGKTIVAGGPLFTTGHEEFDKVDHFMLGEAEEIVDGFAADLEDDDLKKIYRSESYPSIERSPVPDWSLLENIQDYNSMCIQFSRGCPFNCEFCDIVILNGRKPRIKKNEQILEELDSLYDQGWRGGVFFVDDNFIGNKKQLKNEALPAIIEWQRKKNYPFYFNTQVSINLADDDRLIEGMVDARFTTVFVGIETPDPKGLAECSKYQNKNRDMISSVKKLQNAGMEIQGGFIIGFDSDTPTIFQRQIDFIQKSGIITAMVGLLSALPKTRLYKRLVESKRLLSESSANNTVFSTMNFIPKMDLNVIQVGYQKVLDTIYSPKSYYERVKTFIREFKPPKKGTQKLKLYHIKALIASFWLNGVVLKGRRYFWKFMLWSIFKYPALFPYAVGFALTRVHFSSVAKVQESC